MNRAEAEDRGVWEPDNEPDTIEEKVQTPFDLELPEYVKFEGEGIRWKVSIPYEDSIRLAAQDGSGRVSFSSVTALRLALDNGTILDDDQLNLSKN